jgi:hypothetical protein
MLRARFRFRASQVMAWLFGVYVATSLLHFAHNAEYLAQYPNLPASWSRADVCLAWCGVTIVGLVGYFLFHGRYRRTGLTVLAVYGFLGLGGLLHYARAPIAHHSAAMNLTIWSEAAAATLFLFSVATAAIQQLRRRATTAA